jgi:hypothetical protein
MPDKISKSFAEYKQEELNRVLREAAMAGEARTGGAPQESAEPPVAAVLHKLCHDIRSPMGGVVNMLEVLDRKVRDNGDARYVSVALRMARELLHMVGDMQEVERMIHLQPRARPQPFSLRDLLLEACQEHMAAAGDHGPELLVDSPDGLPDRVEGDRCRLAELLRALLRGLRQKAESGPISLQVRPVPATPGANGSGRFQLHCLTGCPPGVRAPALSRFARNPFLDLAEADHPLNSGLELILVKCRLLARTMGGDLSVRTGPDGDQIHFHAGLRLLADTAS